ncbi:uncharacterized protein BDR25DRAFT_362373 [Lindgomyces ingoldianus]|uniref:Uncharacterized protein n=1 Tax=Lindgomyces ingoldianus TaxID=673940 RepID=A0ACB6QA73_9PLEO|nr:uncharacterized protein BDR25DRAFT_362373 [Lindgomyces ingoldianus]KAF2463824.1 hypothetical protein BDR25DRAFT_362373 [Lindgomyces ingoldianus]
MVCKPPVTASDLGRKTALNWALLKRFYSNGEKERKKEAHAWTVLHYVMALHYVTPTIRGFLTYVVVVVYDGHLARHDVLRCHCQIVGPPIETCTVSRGREWLEDHNTQQYTIIILSSIIHQSIWTGDFDRSHPPAPPKSTRLYPPTCLYHHQNSLN